MPHKQLVEVCNFTDTAKTINAPICDGVLGNVPVDSVVGSYLLNPSKFHTETVYDTQNAAIGGTITYTYTAPRNVALDLNSVTVTNDGLFGFWTDFGDGYNDFGNVPDHTYNADGAYEIKTYAILNSRNKVLINAKEVTILSGIITYAPTGNTSTISRPYKHTINAALQNYCDITPQGSSYLANGSTYTPIGTLSLLREVIIDELEDNGDYQVATAGASVVPTAVTPIYSTNRTLQTINTTPAAYTVATIANSREITVQNLTNADITVTTSQGAQTVGTRGVITLSNPNNTTVNHNVFTGNITVTFLSSVGGNVGGVAPRVIINQKAY